jgi:hypothetical protein
MGVKHHYQQHSNYVISRQVSLNDGENWSTLTSFKLTQLYHMMYTVHLYTIPKRTLARQHTFGYAGFIWYYQAPVIVCCVVNQNLPSLFIKGKRKTNYDACILGFFSLTVNITCTCGNLWWQIFNITRICIMTINTYWINTMVRHHPLSMGESMGLDYVSVLK